MYFNGSAVADVGKVCIDESLCGLLIYAPNDRDQMAEITCEAIKNILKLAAIIASFYLLI